MFDVPHNFILCEDRRKLRGRNLKYSYFSLLVMNSNANSVAPSARSRPDTPLLDEKMEAQPDSQTSAAETPATVDEMRCEYLDETFFAKKGVIVQFINGNCAGSTSLIGGMRLAITDIKKVPAYLSRTKLQLKIHAMKYLQAHLQSMQCCIGATEALCAEDYGMSFSVASVSQAGAALNPGKRNEGPLFFCLFSGLVEPAIVTLSDWDLNVDHDVAHVVNCYIHLLPASQRRRMVIKKSVEEKPVMRPNTDDRSQAIGGKIKKQRMVPAPHAQKYVPHQRPHQNEKRLTQEISQLKQEVVQMKLAVVPNPPLPSTSGPRWPTIDLCPDMPDE